MCQILDAFVAQLDRALGYEPRGYRFESYQGYKKRNVIYISLFFV